MISTSEKMYHKILCKDVIHNTGKNIPGEKSNLTREKGESVCMCVCV